MGVEISPVTVEIHPASVEISPVTVEMLPLSVEIPPASSALCVYFQQLRTAIKVERKERRKKKRVGGPSLCYGGPARALRN